MPASDDTGTLAGLYGWMLAPLTEWTRLIAAAQEIRNVDDEWMRTMLEDRAVALPASPPVMNASFANLAPMLKALDLDPETIRTDAPAKMFKLEQACSACTKRSHCDRELTAGMAAITYLDFCPNAARLEDLVREAKAAA
ncbi:hypothetical protein [Methylobacterium nodulans]|uniref:Uncharacterized protein n=1 Tax=Methylobacterium nodulans (strain LMG 21967 / CNCM I-2342 / ORS 2060) TaxID=460265 RepID=B8IH65_METNO|nr:hypothetical protein [Methylobacterium nodulans]ACL59757.1 conserved hypothetical protein [Methylobacterium nodulans ORS 2060]